MCDYRRRQSLQASSTIASSAGSSNELDEYSLAYGSGYVHHRVHRQCCCCCCCCCVVWMPSRLCSQHKVLFFFFCTRNIAATHYRCRFPSIRTQFNTWTTTIITITTTKTEIWSRRCCRLHRFRNSAYRSLIDHLYESNPHRRAIRIGRTRAATLPSSKRCRSRFLSLCLKTLSHCCFFWIRS